MRGFYSYKACYLAGVLRLLHESGLDAEVCSGREYLLARRMGLPPERIAWNAVSLSDDELELAVHSGVSWLGVNSADDIERLSQVASSANRRVDVMIRIQPAGVPSAYLGPGSRLGFATDDDGAVRAAGSVLASDWLELRGVHSHTQVRQTDPGLHAEVVRASLEFAGDLGRRTGHRLRTVSIGGGLACAEQMRRHGTNVTRFAAAVVAARDEIDPTIELALEPGRFLVSDTAVGLASVLSRTGSARHPWIIIDLGTQVLVPFEGREFEVRPATAGAPGSRDTEPTVTTGVGDRMSSYSGVITAGAALPPDLGRGPVVVLDIGAYTTSVAQRFMYGMPDVVLVDGADVEQLWRAEDDQRWVDQVIAQGGAGQ